MYLYARLLFGTIRCSISDTVSFWDHLMYRMVPWTSSLSQLLQRGLKKEDLLDIADHSGRGFFSSRRTKIGPKSVSSICLGGCRNDPSHQVRQDLGQKHLCLGVWLQHKSESLQNNQCLSHALLRQIHHQTRNFGCWQRPAIACRPYLAFLIKHLR